MENAYKDASGGAYIVSAGIYESRGRIEYEIDFPAADTYYLFLRTWASNPADNGVFVCLDGKKTDNPDYSDGLYFYKENGWQWATKVLCGDGCHEHTPYFVVEKPGKHVLSLRVKEVGAKIDRIAFRTTDSVPGDSLERVSSAPAHAKISRSKTLPIALAGIAVVVATGLFVLLRRRRKTSASAAPKQLSPVADKAVAYIRGHYAEEMSIADVARSVALSEDYVGKIFKKDTGTNFIQYLNDYRIEKAMELLKTTDMNVTEIHFRVGINHSSYFAKLFKQRFGVLPSEVARQSSS